MATFANDGTAHITPADLPRATLKGGMTEDRRGLRLVARLDPFEGCLDAPELIPAGGEVVDVTLFGALQCAFIFREYK